jgi:hypothetical protein
MQEASALLTSPTERRPGGKLKNVRTEIALHVLAYNLKRVMNIMGIGPLLAAIKAV